MELHYLSQVAMKSRFDALGREYVRMAAISSTAGGNKLMH